MDSLMQAALWYADMGLYVFPCKPETKKPATEHGFKDSTTDKDQITKWWTENPKYNIGIWASEESGIFVLDIDKKHGGLTTIAKLEKEQGPLPDSWTVQTGGGGTQIYFKHPGKWVGNKTRIAQGIDIRSDNGYVIAPPSIHDKTKQQYKWIKPPLEQALTDVPAWVFELKPKRKASKDQPKGELIPYGQRDDFIFSEAGKLRRIGYEAKQIEKNLEYIFSERCEQEPLPEEGYFRIKAEGVCRYDPATEYFECSDMGNADRFVRRYEGKVLYCPTWKQWLIWGNGRWEKDELKKSVELAKEVIRQIRQEANDADKNGDTKQSGTLYKWYIKSQAKERVLAILKLAESQMAVSSEEFDKDAWLFNVKNGTIDLKTGELKPHSSEDKITKLAPVKYDPDAKAPIFHRFLNDIFLKRSELIEFVQKFFGYSLTADVQEKVFMIFQGKGNNGKTTLLEVIVDVMGDYATTINPEVLMEKKQSSSGSATPEIAKIRGTRLVCAQENEEHKRLGAALVKRLTGKDTLTARFLHAEEFIFKPTFKLLLGTNFLPRISANDQAAWNRVRRVPFDVTVKTENNPSGTLEDDKNLDKKLRGEMPGILAWCVRGCLLWQQEGLRQPECVSDATSEYRESEDIIGTFLEECADFSGDESTLRSTFYKAYTRWCEENKHRALSSTRFKDALVRKGFETKRSSQGFMWLGVGLSEGAEVEENF